MNRETIKKQIIKLAHYYKYTDLDASDLDIYADHLQDMTEETLTLAIERHIESCEWMPKVSQIREAAMKNLMQAAGVPSADVAWTETVKNLRDDRLSGVLDDRINRIDEHEWSHPIVKEAASNLDWKSLYWMYKNGGTSEMMSNRARFMDAYRDLVSKLKDHYSLNPDLRRAIEPPKLPMIESKKPKELPPQPEPDFGDTGWGTELARKKLAEAKERMERK